MREVHPRLNIEHLTIISSRIIIGSFPPLANVNIIDGSKLVLNELKYDNAIPFFFGSKKNQFWNWYKIFFDASIDSNDVQSIKKSLNSNLLGITDLILSCERKGNSGLDKNLFNKVYNHNFFNYPSAGMKLKLLCTSKGLMNDMLLNNAFFFLHPLLKINSQKSQIFQESFLRSINAEITILKNPICIVIEVEMGGIIECLCLPSPGSPFRKLSDFGLNNESTKAYLDSYLKGAFSWFEN